MEGKNIIGKRVRMARNLAIPSISQENLAARLQVEGLESMNQDKVSRIETGERAVYDFEVVALAKCLHVTASWLLGED